MTSVIFFANSFESDQAQHFVKLFVTVMVLLEEFFESENFEKYQQTIKKHGKLPSMQRVKSLGLEVIASET